MASVGRHHTHMELTIEDREAMANSSTRDHRDAQIDALKTELNKLRQTRATPPTARAGSSMLGASQSQPYQHTSGSAYFDSHRTLNGHNQLTSTLSSTEIGARHVSTFNPEYVKAYRRAADDSIYKSKMVRTAKSLDQMMGATVLAEVVQPNSKIYKNSYPETHKKLREFHRQKYTNATPRVLNEATTHAFDRDIHFHPPKDIFMEPNAMTRKINEEEQWNRKERLYNKDRASQTVVHKTITGEFERSNKDDILIPVGATHQQVLGLDNKLVGMNPNVNAPMTRQPLRWYGDTVGWAGNNGLRNTEAQKRFKDSMLAVTRGDLVGLKGFAVREDEVFNKQDAIPDLTPRTARSGTGGLDTSRFY